MNKSKQIIVGPLPPPVGGVSACASNLNILLRNNGIAVDFFNTSGGGESEDLYSNKGFNSYIRNIQIFYSFFKFLLARKQFDVCHIFVVSNSGFLRDGILLLIAKLLRKKVVVHFHSKTEGELFLSGGYFKILSYTLNRADKIIVLSEEHASHFSKAFSREKIFVLENFVFSSKGLTCDVESREFLYVGRLSHKKGIYDLVDAVDYCVNKLNYSHFKINCLGLAENSENFSILIDRVAAKGLTRFFNFAGMITGAEKKGYFQKSACLVFPSHFENSPVVLKEAIEFGLPVICSDIQANKNIVDRAGNSLMFNVGDFEKLGDCLINFLDSLDVRNNLHDMAISAFKYDENYAFKKLEEVIHEF